MSWREKQGKLEMRSLLLLGREREQEREEEQETCRLSQGPRKSGRFSDGCQQSAGWEQRAGLSSRRETGRSTRASTKLGFLQVFKAF